MSRRHIPRWTAFVALCAVVLWGSAAWAQSCSHDCELSQRDPRTGCCPSAPAVHPSGRPSGHTVVCASIQHISAGHCCRFGEEYIPANRRCVCVNPNVCGTGPGQPAATPEPIPTPVPISTPAPIPPPPTTSFAAPPPVPMQSFGPPPPVVPPPAEGGGVLTFTVDDHDESFQVMVEAPGVTRTCPQAVLYIHPCRLTGIPPGPARITVSGSEEFYQDVQIPMGASVVHVHRQHHGWRTGFWIGFGVTLGLVAVGGYLALVDDLGSGDGTVGATVSETGLGLLVASSVGFGVAWGIQSHDNHHILDPLSGANGAATTLRLEGLGATRLAGGGIAPSAVFSF